MPAGHIPPLRFHALTPAYDALVRWTSAEPRFRSAVLAAIGDESPKRILDVGCGTASFALMLERAFPGAVIVGVDMDEAALRIGAAKIASAGARSALCHSDARDLPFADAEFDVATASLFFHHLADADKQRVLRELHRCLARDGLLAVADWHRPSSIARRVSFGLVRLLDGLDVTRAHAHGRFPVLLRQAGFDVACTTLVDAPLGCIGVWRCVRGADAPR